ncbi:MAG: hypothetical protein MUE49_14575, partial [Rhodospirillales bacterium]|nr:hypothetical protein [Rhodospirillales bacterium]
DGKAEPDKDRDIESVAGWAVAVRRAPPRQHGEFPYDVDGDHPRIIAAQMNFFATLSTHPPHFA